MNFAPTRISAAAALAVGGLSALAPAAFAQEVPQRVEITGSAIKRIDAETALPVTIIRREEIDKSGASNAQELIDRLSFNNGGGRSLGESIGDSDATGQTGASLRGLGRERTLILLNGRRLTPYPFVGLGVDLNAIPLAAIERIEVLRDGASATYGSDAIGGVINFITRKDYEGGELTVGYEKPEATGGEVSSLSGGFGFGNLATNGFNVLGSFSYQKYGVIRAADRPFASTGNRPDIGVVKTSGNTFPANAFIGDPDHRQYFDYVPGAAGFPDCDPPDSFDDGSSGNCRYDFTHYIDIVPESERIGGIVRGALQLGNDHMLFAELGYTKNEITFGSSQTPSSTTGRADYLYPGGGRWYPTAAVDEVAPGYRGDLVIAWRIVDGGQRRTMVTNEMKRAVVGAEGSFLNWDYKAGLLVAEATAKEDFLTGNYSDERLVLGLATGDINPFGPNDAAGLAALASAELSGNNRDSKTTTKGVDFQMSREAFSAPGGMASVAFGTDLRTEDYTDGYSELAGSGDIVGGSGTAGKVTGERDVTAAFGELNVPVLKTLELNGAVRMDRYSNTKGSSRDGDFETDDMSATSPKLSLRWTPTKQLLVRASVGRGFRAPPLDNLYAPAAGSNTGGNFNDPYYDSVTGCVNSPNPNYCNTQLTTLNNSNPNLKPEKSKTYSLGLVFEPIPDLSLGIDYFNMEITNAIITVSADDILVDWFANRTGPTTSTSAYADRLVVDPATGYLAYVNASLENTGKLKAAGFDLSARYRMRTPFGIVSPGWEATYMTDSSETNVVTGVEEDTLGKYVTAGPIVRLKQNLTLDWESGPWAAGVHYYWQSGYQDYDKVSDVNSYELWDLQALFKGIKNLILTAGVRNLSDKEPPVTVQEDYFQVGFDPTYADVKGRTFYMRASYKF
jgi:iron complex outermembrane receptor protein